MGLRKADSERWESRESLDICLCKAPLNTVVPRSRQADIRLFDFAPNRLCYEDGLRQINDPTIWASPAQCHTYGADQVRWTEGFVFTSATEVNLHVPSLTIQRSCLARIETLTGREKQRKSHAHKAQISHISPYLCPEVVYPFSSSSIQTRMESEVVPNEGTVITTNKEDSEACLDTDPDITSMVLSRYEDPFVIFSMPRELRDSIYDNALVDEATFKLGIKLKTTSSEVGEQVPVPRPEDALDELPALTEMLYPELRASVRFRASITMLLACKALREEYEERAKQAMVLVLRDSEKYSFQFVTLPDGAKEVQHAELHLILFCHSCPAGFITHFEERDCQAADEVTQHRTWIEDVLSQLSKLQSLCIHAYLCSCRYKLGSKGKFPCEKIVLAKIDELRDLANLKELTLCKYDFKAAPDLNGPKEMILEWPSKPKNDVKGSPTASQEAKEVPQETEKAEKLAEETEDV